MKTLVFHSVKGGVGRSMALAVMAEAISKKFNKKVLMFDFDYMAPGLPDKFKKTPRSGYIEYLQRFNASARAGEVSDTERWACLESSIERLGSGLYLLHAGNTESQNYWFYLNSFEFHRLFYFTADEMCGLAEPKTLSDMADRNRQAFKEDLRLIQEKFQPDYLLLDCKTTLETSAQVLLMWADGVAHFMPANDEGIRYAIDCAWALTENSSLSFTPVVCRVPDNFDEEDRRQNFTNKLQRAWHAREGVRTLPQPDKFFAKPPVFLSELRDLEYNERILDLANGEEGGSKKDQEWQLSHDYVNLFAHMAPELGGSSNVKLSADGWCRQLGIKQHRIRRLKTFDHVLHQGMLINVDNSPNIALRIETLHFLIASLAKQDRQVQDLMRGVGRECGKDFVNKNQEQFEISGEMDVAQVIKKWATFDSAAGFGELRVFGVEDTTDQCCGYLLALGGAFIVEDDGSGCATLKKDLENLFCGYALGVLEQLLIFGNTGGDGSSVLPLLHKSAVANGETEEVELRKLKVLAKSEDVKLRAFEFKIMKNSLPVSEKTA